MKKKLVQINVVCNGSTGRIMNQIQDVAIKNGYEAYSFFGREKPANKNCIKIDTKIEILWHVFISRFFNMHGQGSIFATYRMLKKIDKINPDIIHLHNIHGYYLNYKILFKYLKKKNIPVVWTLHDCWAFTGHCAYFSMVECNKWKSQCEKCEQKHRYPKSVIMDNSKKQFKKKKELFNGINNLTIVTPSEWLENLVQQSFLKKYNTLVINNGINLEDFKPTRNIDIKDKYNIPKNKKIVLGVAANWEKRKGIEEFVKLSTMLDEDTIIVLVGLSKKQIESMPNNVFGIERTESINDLANLYTQADIFVNLTLEDNFPTTNLEAMACGTYAVTYNSGGSGETIIDNCGIAIKRSDIEAVKDVIDKKIQYKINAEDLKQRKKFDKEITFTKYLNLYEEIINKN